MPNALDLKTSAERHWLMLLLHQSKLLLLENNLRLANLLLTAHKRQAELKKQLITSQLTLLLRNKLLIMLNQLLNQLNVFKTSKFKITAMLKQNPQNSKKRKLEELQARLNWLKKHRLVRSKVLRRRTKSYVEQLTWQS